MKFILKITILAIGLHSCNSSPKKTPIAFEEIQYLPQSHFLDYNFTSPEIFNLPSKLKEISGLSFDFKKGELITINDEEGFVYNIHPQTGKLINHQKFSKKGDYEGIAMVKNKIVITESSGELFFFNPKKGETTNIKTKFSSKNDIEGLCYDLEANQLLIACKGIPIEGKKKDKGIYSFNLKKRKLEKTPFLVIRYKELNKQLKNQYENITKKKLETYFKRIRVFAPSGIAIHPKTKDTYILSARGSSLIVYNSLKKIKQILFLNPKEIPQPEGICFDSSANLFISTEGQSTTGKIFRYTYLK